MEVPIHHSETENNMEIIAPTSGLKDNQSEDSSNTPVKPKEIDQTSISTDYPTLELNDNLNKELDCSILLETINTEMVDTVSTLVEGLGFDDVIIRGLLSTKFLAFFYLEEDLSKVDLDFLGIGFKVVRKLEVTDLIPTRNT